RIAVAKGSGVVEMTEADWSIGDGMKAVVGLEDADRLADESFAQEDATAEPLDLTVAAYPSHLMIVGVLRLGEPTRVGSRRRLIMCGRRVETKRLMRTLFVEDPAEVVETLLLSPLIGCRRVGGLLLQRSVHSLMATVLLRLARLDPFGCHPC